MRFRELAIYERKRTQKIIIWLSHNINNDVVIYYILWGDILGRMEASIEINVPPENVWEMIAMDGFRECAEGVKKDLKSMEYTSEVCTPEDKYRVGAMGRQNLNHQISRFYEITESRTREDCVSYDLYGQYSNISLRTRGRYN